MGYILGTGNSHTVNLKAACGPIRGRAHTNKTHYVATTSNTFPTGILYVYFGTVYNPETETIHVRFASHGGNSHLCVLIIRGGVFVDTKQSTAV